MVQIIPRIPSTSERFGQAFVNTGKNLAGIGGEYLIQKKEKNLRDENFSKENEFFKKRFGIDISNVKNPELRQKYFDMALQAENQKNLQSQKAKDELGLASQQSQNAFNSASQLQSQKHGLGLEELAQKHQYNLGESSQQSQNAFNNASQLQSQKHGFDLEKITREQQNELSNGLMDYETVKKFAGQNVADFYKAAPVGGKTKIVQSIVDSLQRGEKFGDMLGAASSSPERQNNNSINAESPFEEELSQNDSSGKLNLPDYNIRPAGFTPKEWAAARTGWSKSNNEALSKARDRIKGNKRDILGTKKLQKLNDSGELPEGLERWIINPNNGEVYGYAQLAQKSPKAAQEWVKEIARFGNRAKDAFGSRVTNFDLFQYMKQFPSLLNTPDGRRNILRMMEINYDLDSLYDSAVQRIIDEKGVSNIPPEEVDRVARNMIQDREEKLFDEYLNLDTKNESSFMNEGLKENRPSLQDIFG